MNYKEEKEEINGNDAGLGGGGFVLQQLFIICKTFAVFIFIEKPSIFAYLLTKPVKHQPSNKSLGFIKVRTYFLIPSKLVSMEIFSAFKIQLYWTFPKKEL